MLRKVILLIILVSLFLIYMRIFEYKSIFYPEKTIEFTPLGRGLNYEDIFFKTQDGLILNGWFIPAQNQDIVVLYFHGNAGNISHRIEVAKLFNERNFSFFIFDYRGFGRSQGSPSELGTYLDAIAAYEYLVKTKRIPPEKIVLYGKSLGAAVAIDLASKVKAGALISESGFSSIVNLAKDIYKFIPLWLFVTQKYDSLKKVGTITMPKLFIHSKNDEIVPFKHAQMLFTAAKEPKELYVMQGGHNDAFYIYNQECMLKISDFLKRHLK
ncbi:MAG: alpha/beta hydrolase [Candidatus Omnitrophica bacterium]|nr:alpha/beta hydrolase [Candidatus Omnitrophota bacterium]